MGGVFLLLQLRSKHPRELVITPKASTSILTGVLLLRERRRVRALRQGRRHRAARLDGRARMLRLARPGARRRRSAMARARAEARLQRARERAGRGGPHGMARKRYESEATGGVGGAATSLLGRCEFNFIYIYIYIYNHVYNLDISLSISISFY